MKKGASVVMWRKKREIQGTLTMSEAFILHGQS